jgi:molybdate transport system regulatory protein
MGLFCMPAAMLWSAMAKLRLRVDLEPAGAVGPGKIELLERIDELGSIAAAGRAMRMSYRRAWELIDNINQCFREPLVSKQLGGTDGGGAKLTRLGRDVVRHYRAIEKKAARAAAAHLTALQAAGEKQPRQAGGRADRD